MPMETCNECGSEEIESTVALVSVTDECQNCGHTETNL
jgi:hypothetical protein